MSPSWDILESRHLVSAESMHLSEGCSDPTISKGFFPTLVPVNCNSCESTEPVQKHWTVDGHTYCLECFDRLFGDFKPCASHGCGHYVTVAVPTDNDLCECCEHRAYVDGVDDDDDEY